MAKSGRRPLPGGARPLGDREGGGAEVDRTFGDRLQHGADSDSRRRRGVHRWGLAIAAGLVALRLCCPFSIGVVEGRSMTPTYRPGQLFILDRHYYRDHPIRRGDVVVVHSDDHTMIKRVFGLAGDSIWLLIQSDGNRIDRYVIDPEMLPRLRRTAERWDLGRITHLKVPPGTIYLLGDCTEASVDSRSFGAVPTSAIMGLVKPPRPGSRLVINHQ
jgi:signal peptidase I